MAAKAIAVWMAPPAGLVGQASACLVFARRKPNPDRLKPVLLKTLYELPRNPVRMSGEQSVDKTNLVAQK